MNNTKENFLLQKSQREVFEALSDEEAGKLIKGVFKYLDTGNSDLEGVMKAIFIPIKNEIDKNEEKYQKRCEKNRENINKRWNKKEKIRNNTNVYQSIPNDSDNNHISYIINHKSNIINSIIEYLNNKTNSKFKSTTKSTQQKINARLNEGYKLNDFIAVIDKKYNEWVGTEFEQYLCPDTLFGTKFEKYLNQKEAKKKEPIPDWFDKEIKQERIEWTDEQKREFEEFEKQLQSLS